MAALTWPVDLYQKHILLESCATSDPHLFQKTILRFETKAVKYCMFHRGKNRCETQGMRDSGSCRNLCTNAESVRFIREEKVGCLGGCDPFSSEVVM